MPNSADESTLHPSTQKLLRVRHLNNASKQRHRDKSKALGICSNCNRPVEMYKSKCKVCLKASTRAQDRKVERLRRIKAGKCPDCSRPMDEDADKGYITCVNCRSRSTHHAY